MTDELLSPEFINHLERLQIQSKKIIRGKMKGERRSQKKGQSIEFADFRQYVPGDDLRFLDWNVYARVEKLFLKLFMEEEDLSISILLDVSGSMQVGNPSKLLYAKKIAAALAYIGLHAQDRISVFQLNNRIHNALTNIRGRSSAHRIFEFLKFAKASGTTGLSTAMHEFVLKYRRKGVVFLITDFMDRAGFDETLKILYQLESDVAVIQLFSEEEYNPDLTEDFSLIDIEDEVKVEISKSDYIQKMYKKTLELFIDSIQKSCMKKGFTYAYAINSQPFEDIVLTTLRKYGLIN